MLLEIKYYVNWQSLHQSRNGSSFFGTSGDRVSESGYSEKLDVSPALPIWGM